jgi:hypothetical protein
MKYQNGQDRTQNHVDPYRSEPASSSTQVFGLPSMVPKFRQNSKPRKVPERNFGDCFVWGIGGPRNQRLDEIDRRLSRRAYQRSTPRCLRPARPCLSREGSRCRRSRRTGLVSRKPPSPVIRRRYAVNDGGQSSSVSKTVLPSPATASLATRTSSIGLGDRLSPLALLSQAA